MDCAPTPSTLAQSKERKGSNFAIWQHSIQNVPKRDRIAHELAEKNSKFYRDKKGKAISKARQAIKTPKGSLTERVAGMSPAAQRLASTKLGIRLGTDKALRASYTPSPARDDIQCCREISWNFCEI